MDRQMSILQPYLDQQRQSWEQSMANRGVGMNSDVYQKSLATQNDKESRQLTDLLLRGRDMSMKEMLAQRNQPLNELNAFRTGSQVSMPQFMNTPQTSMGAPSDMGSLFQNQYEAKKANYDAGMGAVSGMAGTAMQVGLPLLMSDERVKEDIKEVGALNDGTKVYSYRYKWGGPIQIGVMAQEAIEQHPDAIHNVDGLLMVDYGKISEAQ